MNRTLLAAAVLALSVVPVSALRAHGPVVQIGVAGDRIVTYGLPADTADYADPLPPQRAYVVPMTRLAAGNVNDGWYAAPNPAYVPLGPGLAYGGRGFGGGVVIRESIVDGLKRWNGVAFLDPGTEEVQGLRGNFAVPTATFSTATGAVNDFTLTTPATVAATAHSQVTWRLLGDGVNPDSASADGVYLLTLQLRTDQPGVAASAPFYFLLTKNAAPADVAAAGAFVNSTLVPEPATLTVLGAAAFALRRRQRNEGTLRRREP